MHQDATDSEVQRLLRPLSTKWVQAVAGVSRDTVAGWRDGTQQPRPDRWDKLVEAVRQTLPEHEEAAPSEEGAAAELLRLWKGSVPPDWSNVQVDKITDAVRALRDWTAEEAVQAALDRAEAAEREKRLRASKARGTSGRKPSTSGGLGARRKRASE